MSTTWPPSPSRRRRTQLRTQLNARLDTKITPDGWSPASAQAEVPTSRLSSTFRTSVPGTRGGPIELTIKKDDTPGSDTVYNLFKTGPSGNLVAREAQGGASAAYAAGQIVTVIPGKAGKPRLDPTAENTPRPLQGDLVPVRRAVRRRHRRRLVAWADRSPLEQAALRYCAPRGIPLSVFLEQRTVYPGQPHWTEDDTLAALDWQAEQDRRCPDCGEHADGP